MPENQAGKHTQLFTLRVWVEDVGDGRTEIRGQIKHVLTSETVYFREWDALVAFLQQWTTTGETVGELPNCQ